MLKAQINTKTILKNIKIVRGHLGEGVRLCAVVKANAYGLGDVLIAKIVSAAVDWFAVARMSEALRLREAGISHPILLFGICDDVKKAVQNNIIVSVNSLSEMQHICTALEGQECKLRIHIKVNTGMNRYGITSPWQLRSILALAARTNTVIVDGLYTHMSHETDNTACIERQLQKFVPFRAMLKRSHPRAIIHAACSGSFHYKPSQFDMVRIGKSMYGGFDGYKTAITLTSKVTAVQHVPRGSGVNYNARWVAECPTTIGVVPCGYADIGSLCFHASHVMVGKHLCPIIGVVCMDTFAVDVTGMPCPLGKVVRILGPDAGISIMDFVKKSGRSACPLLCSLNFNRTVIRIL